MGVVERVPVSWEEKLADHTFAEIRKSTRLISDNEVLAGVRTLVQPLLDGLAADSDLRSYNYTFNVVDEPTLNAFALPGGRVTLHSELLLAVERPEEILGVLAHELAHVTRQHSLR